MTIDNAVGIDVSMHESTFVGLRRPDEVVLRSRLVPHTADELREIAGEILALPGSTVAFCECTGVYHEPVVKSLRDAGVAVVALNPLLVHKFGGNTLRKVETDKADAKKIALYGLTWGYKFALSVGEDPVRVTLKAVSTFSLPNRRQLSAIIFTHCPSGCFRVCPRCLAVRIATTALSSGRISLMSSLMQNVSAGSAWRSSMSVTKSGAKNTDTMRFGRLKSGTAAVYLKRMVELAKSLPEYETVALLYGCGDATGPQLIAEIGDVRRFAERKGSKSLVAFAGVSPGDSQSGTYDAVSNPIEKRGSPYLRRALFCAAKAYLMKSPADEPVYKTLDKKRAEGKKYLVYMTAAMNKFLKVYYARVMEQYDRLSVGEVIPA